MRHKLTAIIVTTVAAAGSLFGVAVGVSPAHAWTTSNCQQGAGSAGYLCYYFSANYMNAREGIADAVCDLDGTITTNCPNGHDPIVYQFPDNFGHTRGEGSNVGSDAHSGVNRRTDCTARMWDSPDSMGADIAFSPCCATGQNPPYQEGDLGALDNHNVSQNFCG
jgi:hypothetical protein